MRGRAFFDTNLLIYLYSEDEPQKQSTVRKVWADSSSVISTQVLQELSNTLSRKFSKGSSAISILLDEVQTAFEVHTNSSATIREALRLAERYKYSFYDSLIIAAALESGCSTLYSEDMQHGQMIDGVLRISNPIK